MFFFAKLVFSSLLPMIFLIKYLLAPHAMKHKYFYITILLLVSLWIYVCYRTEHTIINQLMSYLLTDAHFQAMQQAVSEAIPLPSIVIYSLPEGLWILATTITSEKIVLKLGKFSIALIYIPLWVCLGIEIVQYVGWSKGVFDWLDVGIVVLFWLVGYLFTKQATPKIENSRLPIYYTAFNYSIVFLSCVWK